MDGRHTIDIKDWGNIPHAVVSQQYTSRRRWSPAIFGLTGTLVIHATIIQSLYIANRTHHAHPREIFEPAISGVNSVPDSAENLVLVDLQSTFSPRDRVTVNVAAANVVNKMLVAMPDDPEIPILANIETLALDGQWESEAISTNRDGEERARLLGIYTGQIQARIDRIWRRPRTPIGELSSATAATTADESFQCQVQVVQDTRGNVQEVLLLDCGGSQAWRQSLILAIQQASPLPAPPSPKVFSQSITLNFVGLAYVAGSPKDDYETLPSDTAQIISTQSASHVSPGSMK